jgi:predicted enzyme related to lactoylglutathione lyase
MPKRDVHPVGAPTWIDLFTSDPAKSKTFYGELFGWASEEAGDELGNYITFSKDEQAVAGGMRNNGDSGMPDLWTVYLATDDIKEVVDRAAANGGGVIVEPMDIPEVGTMAVLTDAGGAGIGAWQPGGFDGFGVLEEDGAPSWFELHTRDYDASVAFYQKVFGWGIQVMGDSPEFRYTTRADGPGGMLAGIMDATAFLPEGVPAHWSIYFEVDDVDAALAKTVELGGSVVQAAEDTPYGRLATATDSTGAVFKLRKAPQ